MKTLIYPNELFGSPRKHPWLDGTSSTSSIASTLMLSGTRLLRAIAGTVKVIIWTGMVQNLNLPNHSSQSNSMHLCHCAAFMCNANASMITMTKVETRKRPFQTPPSTGNIGISTLCFTSETRTPRPRGREAYISPRTRTCIGLI